MAPLVSIIMPCYNYADFIEEAIESVLSQTEQDWELIIVDDGSTDASRAKALTFDDTRIVVISQKNAGVSAARNRGLQQSTGRYVAFLDADDRMHKARLETGLKVLEHDPSIDMVASNFNRFVNNTAELLPAQFDLVPKWRQLPLVPIAGTDAYRIEGDPVTAVASLPLQVVWIHGVLVRGELARSATFPEGVRICEDSWYFYRLMQTARVALLDRVLASVRRHGKNSFTNPTDALAPELTMYQGLLSEAKQTVHQTAYQRAIGRMYLRMGYDSRMQGRWIAALRCYVQAIAAGAPKVPASKGMLAALLHR